MPQRGLPGHCNYFKQYLYEATRTLTINRGNTVLATISQSTSKGQSRDQAKAITGELHFSHRSPTAMCRRCEKAILSNFRQAEVVWKRYKHKRNLSVEKFK